MLNMLIGPISNIVGNVVKGIIETKKAKAELAVTEIKAKTKLKKIKSLERSLGRLLLSIKWKTALKMKLHL